MKFDKRVTLCDHCDKTAVITVTRTPIGLTLKRASLCMVHTPVPVAGDTLETMYDRYFEELTDE